jgi:hypothetical protein
MWCQIINLAIFLTSGFETFLLPPWETYGDVFYFFSTAAANGMTYLPSCVAPTHHLRQIITKFRLISLECAVRRKTIRRQVGSLSKLGRLFPFR